MLFAYGLNRPLQVLLLLVVLLEHDKEAAPCLFLTSRIISEAARPRNFIFDRP
jgi:hypothetical protein